MVGGGGERRILIMLFRKRKNRPAEQPIRLYRKSSCAGAPKASGGPLGFLVSDRMGVPCAESVFAERARKL